MNGKLGTIRHRRSHGMSSSPSTYRGPMENKGWNYVLRRRSNSPENLLPLVQGGAITESPPVAMDGDDSDDDIRSPTSISRTRILGSSRKFGRVSRVAGTAPQWPRRFAALRVVRPHRGPPSQNPRSRTTPMLTQSSSQAAPRASVGSQHFLGTRKRAAGHSPAPEGAHWSGEVRSVRRQVGSSSRPSSPPILVS